MKTTANHSLAAVYTHYLGMDPGEEQCFSFDPSTQALHVVFKHPRKTVRFVKSSKAIQDSSVKLARADYDESGLLLQLEIHPL